ncbi:MAG: hypothetical protein IJ783_06840 [Kiritimatiellae bacterium]|nr:hypothetical protein [Kiritimatiellia bacterium]
MKFLNHLDPKWNPRPVKGEEIVEFQFDNSREPVVRNGEESFKIVYAPEPNDLYCNFVDPSRSMMRPAHLLVDETENGIREEWDVADILCRLVLDLHLESVKPTAADRSAFRAMFPLRVARLLARSWLKWGGLLGRDVAYPLVLNNPFFHLRPCLSERRLATIWEADDVSFALDRTAFIPHPTVIAREVALHEDGATGVTDEGSTMHRLESEISETMSDNGLVPTDASGQAISGG